MKSAIDYWPRGPSRWIEGEVLNISVPFTWNLPAIRSELLQLQLFTKRIRVGGPAVDLMPDFLADLGFVEFDPNYSDPWSALRRVNPLATRTTQGCPRHCEFCGVGQKLLAGGVFREFEDWPLAPMICDDNFLCSSINHFDFVIEELKKLPKCDFQGLDARCITGYRASRLAELPGALMRLACDTDDERTGWFQGFRKLRAAGISKSRIRTYVLIGFEDGPNEGWDRCRFVDDQGSDALPMWYHSLTAMQHNAVTEEQRALGWTYAEYAKIMGHYWQFKK